MKRIQARWLRIRRPLRWLMCWALACLVFFIALATFTVLNRMHVRDVAIVETQKAEQGTLLSQDHSACSMSVDLHGETINAATSCNTSAAFPAGTPVPVVQDPGRPGYFLVVAPGQDWQMQQDFELRVAVLVGAGFGPPVFFIGYRVVLLDARPAATKPRHPTTLAHGAPGRARREAPRSPVDRIEKWWGSRKSALV